MKLMWIIFIFIALWSSCEGDDSEDLTEPQSLSYPTRSALNSEIKDGLSHNDNPSHNDKSNPVILELSTEVDTNAPKNIKEKDNLVPRKQTKNNLNGKNKPSFVMSTRRPLMKSRTFTSKPHAVYNFEWRFGGQNNYASKRNTNARKQFKSKPRNTHQHNRLRDSAENPFRYFKNMDTSGEDETVSSLRSRNTASKARRIAAAASEIRSVTMRTHTNINSANVNLRRKANAAIQKSLQNMKAMRPELKNKPIIVHPTSVNNKNNTKVKVVKEDIKNKEITSSKNNVINATTNKNINYEPEINTDRNDFILKDHDSTSIATVKDEGISAESSTPVHASEIRSKRGVNIIEEEHVATTSTGFKFTGHESMGAEFNFKNIHT